jgi:hypothetical protein
MNKIEFKIQYRAFREGLRDVRERYPSSSKAWETEIDELLSQFPSVIRQATFRSRFIAMRPVMNYSERQWYKINSREFPVQHVRGVKLNIENQEKFNVQFYHSRRASKNINSQLTEV